MDISIAEMHNRLSYWIKQVDEEPITITRRGKPVGVIIAPEEYERLRKAQAYLQMESLSKTLQDSGITAAELYEHSRQELEQKR